MTPERSTTRLYAWPRFWTRPGEHVGDGFFPEAPSLFTSVPDAWRLSELVNEPCLVLLGEPGMGKSQAIRDAAAEMRGAGHAVHVVAMGAYEDGASLIGAIVDSPVWRTWQASDDVLHLFLDGLDEALLHVKAIHKRLIVELQALGVDIARLRLRISCRAAEWLPDFDSPLAEVFGLPDAPPHLALAPLRVADAAEAARAENLDAQDFILEVFSRGLDRLAALPLTLRMLLDEAVAGAGALPVTQAELFDRAVLRLAGEHDVGRRRELAGSALHAGQRVAVAERVAAALLLAGKAAIDADPAAAASGDLMVRELAGYTEQDPAAAGAAAFAVGPEVVEEVLATALFADLGASRLVFAHRSLAEYLAARYLAHHDMDADQVMSLLASADDPDGRVVPQLREVAAWAAAFDEVVLDRIIDQDPELLLRSDGLSLTDGVRARVVDALLTESAAVRVERFDRRVRRAFSTLRHPGLAQQLRDALRADHPLAVRKMALSLAQAAALPELQQDLLDLALGNDEPAYLRDDAVWALKDHADADTRAALVPLATQRIEDDVDDEIKGQALAATFPSPLSVTDVLAVLTPARNEHLLGAYKMFVRNTFVPALRPADMPAALAWAQTVPSDDRSTDLLSSLVDQVLALAWTQINDPAIRAGIVDVVVPRLRQHQRLLGPLHDDDDTQTFRDQHGRRLLVDALANVAAAGELDPMALVSSEPPLIASEDFPWAAGRLRAALGTPTEPAWAALAAWIFTPETHDVGELFDLATVSDTFAERTAGWRTPVSLEGDVAALWRRRAARRQPQQPDAPDPDDMIRQQLDAVDRGDPDAWWQLNLMLLNDRDSHTQPAREIEPDLTRLPGWERVDPQTRDRVIGAAARYLEGSPPDPEQWLATSTLDRRAFAGYRALHLLAKHRPADLEALPADTWTRWMPVVVGYSRLAGDGGDGRFDDAVVTLAAARAPQALIDWTMRVVDTQAAEGDGHLFVLWGMRHLQLPELARALARKLGEPGVAAEAREDLAEFAMRADPAGTLPTVAELLEPEAIDRDRGGAISVAAVALGVAPKAAWPVVEPVFTRDPDLGTRVFERLAWSDRADLAGELDDDAVARLLDWIFEHLPPADDPPLIAGASYPTPRDQAARVRDRLASVLAQRGTDAAVAAIDALAAKFPSYAMMLRQAEARDARLARWTAPDPRDVILLAQRNDARIVLSGAHLQQAVMASLRRIERRLRETSPAELWNTRGQPAPKHEEELSTWLRGRLDEDLRIGGRVVNREVEIRPNRTGRGRGESVDLAIFAPVGTHVEGAPTASVHIEVKGCWHADVTTAMDAQLVQRYLTETGTTHGIYLVFWFAASEWDPDDGRRRRCAGNRDELARTLSGQAATLTATRKATVTAFVLDGSLPNSAR